VGALVVAATPVDYFASHRLVVYRERRPDSGGKERSEIGRRHGAPARPRVPDPRWVCRGRGWMSGTHMGGVEPVIILIAPMLKAPHSKLLHGEL
jgi:hypothetical protein